MKQSFVSGLYATGQATSNYPPAGTDPDAFGEIVRRWDRKIFALCFGMLGREDEARDHREAVQERDPLALALIREGEPVRAGSGAMSRVSKIDNGRRVLGVVEIEARNATDDPNAYRSDRVDER